jgi:hypothetical protein
VHGRGALYRGVDRQIADIIVIKPERELLLERQGVEPTRRGKCPLDCVVGDAVVQRIEEPDIFTGVGNIGGYPIESSRRAGKVRPVIDGRDHSCGRLIILDRILLEEMHSCLRDRHARAL